MAEVLLLQKKIQIPYVNTFSSIWEYKKAYLSGKIDFFSYLGPACPICGLEGCYNERKPYWRNAIEIDPFKKEKVPIARFECRSTRRTFSLLPIQLIPYHQYTAAAVLSMVLLALNHKDHGQSVYERAAEQADPDSCVTAWLVVCWLQMVVTGLRRAHAFLSGQYDLRAIRSGLGRKELATEAAGYLKAIAANGRGIWPGSLITLVIVYSRATGQFFLGRPSQQRISCSL